jgi:hypothetical protein
MKPLPPLLDRKEYAAPLLDRKENVARMRSAENIQGCLFLDGHTDTLILTL